MEICPCSPTQNMYAIFDGKMKKPPFQWLAFTTMYLRDIDDNNLFMHSRYLKPVSTQIAWRAHGKYHLQFYTKMYSRMATSLDVNKNRYRKSSSAFKFRWRKLYTCIAFFQMVAEKSQMRLLAIQKPQRCYIMKLVEMKKHFYASNPFSVFITNYNTHILFIIC